MRNARLGDARGATEMDDARCASDMGDVRGTTDSEMDDDAPRGATEMGNALCRDATWARRIWVMREIGDARDVTESVDHARDTRLERERCV